jgi:SAM-dependent methyltransferase
VEQRATPEVSGDRVRIPDYDELWDNVYGDIQDEGPVHHHMRRLIADLVGGLDYKSLLGVGCGFGHNLPLLLENRRVDRVAGIDISDRALEHMRHDWGDDFHKLDIETERLDRSYDLVFSSLLLEHVRDDLAVLRNMRAMTGRYLLVTTIAGDFERYRPWEDQMGHVRNYRRGELEGKLREAGYEPERVIYWGFPFYTPLARRLQNHMTATHDFSPGTKLVARILRYVYYLNSSRRGDLLVALARV